MGVKSKALEEKFNKKEYFNYLHNSQQQCVVCGRYDIEIHHITDLKNIPNEPRRLDSRIIILCKSHHKESKFGIHNMSKDDFYENVMDFDTLMYHSNRLLEEYKEQENGN